MSERVLVDAAARRTIREALDETLVVEAAAGTGKTSELVQRIAQLLASGRAVVEGVVALTFTEKAAGEMKLRLRAELEGLLRTADDAATRARVEAAIVGLDAGRIGTIHGFCHDLLRERPVEAGVDPGFEVLEEAASKRLFAQVFDTWLERALEAPPEALRRVLRRAGGKGGGLRVSLRRAAYRLVETRDFTAAYRRDPFDRRAALDGVFTSLAEIVPLSERAHSDRDVLAQSLAELGRFVTRIRRREQVADRDHDRLEAELRQLSTSKALVGQRGRTKSYGPGLDRADVLALRDALSESLSVCVRACDADLVALLHAELRPLVQEYERAKAAAGALDFFDLLLSARALLRDHAGVRRELCERFSHLLLDEFQDTDPVQTEIVLLLGSADPDVSVPWDAPPAPGKLFLVGDPKQSIYRFRRADQRFYERVKRHLLGHGARLVELTTSFRSRPAIQSLINASFAPVMQPDEALGRSGYVPLHAFRDDRQDCPSVVALCVPEPYNAYGYVTNGALSASLPAAVGAYVDWLLRESGWTVTEGGREVRLSARHVCLLFRRTASGPEDVVHPYVRELEARHIHHARGGGRAFYQREEVLALRTALEAVEWPDDALSVYAVLRGPFFALSDDVLLRLRERVGGLHPLRSLPREGLPQALCEAADALDVLGRLHAGRNQRPIAHTLSSLLRETRAHAGVAIWPTGEQALGNLLQVGELARRYEQVQRASSFRGFVDWLDAQAEEGESAEAPVVEEGDDGVRILTVHAAKGLEFPVAILCDPAAPRRPRHPSRWVDDSTGLWAQSIMGLTPAELLERTEEVLDQDEAEELRLAYVAATRARDLLVIPAVGDRPPRDPKWAGWLDVFEPALFPPPAARRDARPAPGCPVFGDDSVLDRGREASRGALASVAPGLHRAEAGGHTVVFWDPHVLKLTARPVGGLRQQELLKDDGSSGVANQRLQEFQRWREAWRATAEAAARPGVRARSVTALSAERSEPPHPVEIERCERVAGRPSGARFGSLVHSALQFAREGEGGESLGALVRSLARGLGASDQECAAAEVAVARALAHPLMQRAFAAATRGELYREAPLSLHEEAGEVVEGVVDLAFREGDTWWIVDYKTDADGHLDARYRQQLTLYAQALEQLTDERAQCVLWLV